MQRFKVTFEVATPEGERLCGGQYGRVSSGSACSIAETLGDLKKLGVVRDGDIVNIRSEQAEPEATLCELAQGLDATTSWRSPS